MIARARASLPPSLRNIVIAAFPRRLGVTIIIEAEQDDREMRRLSHYSFDGGYHAGTVRWSPTCLSPVKYLGVFVGFLATMHGYVSFREPLVALFKMKYR